jgi:hypothetical protein
MTKTIRVSDAFHAVVAAHNREGETMEETLRRLTRGPDPEILAEIVGTGDGPTAARMREAIEAKRERGRGRRETLRERFE